MQSKKVMSLRQILLYTFFCKSIFIPSWFLIKPYYCLITPKKESQKYLHKNIIIPPLCQYGLPIQRVSKNLMCLKM